MTLSFLSDIIFVLILEEGIIMSIAKRFFSIFCFGITALCSIFALMGASMSNAMVKEELEEIADEIRYNNWYIAIILFACVLLLLATMLILFSINTSSNANNKSLYLTMFYVSLITSITIAFIWGYIVYDSVRLQYNQTYEDTSSTLALARITLGILANSLYYNEIVLLFVASIPNIVLAFICMKGMGSSALGDDVVENDDANDENFVIKNQIEKLKKQLELEELKEEYKSLYLKANKSKLSKTSDTTKDE